MADIRIIVLDVSAAKRAESNKTLSTMVDAGYRIVAANLEIVQPLPGDDPDSGGTVMWYTLQQD
ncbi:MAG: hypothetical protein JWM34_1419 [Ilumatobacteraceae bacterium]|nr:hypothetical protein [Ilumatobacteraceae bacterium]